MEESFDDYAKRLRDVVESLAAFESRPVIEVLNDLVNVDADTLRYRVASPETGRGSIPLMEGIQLLEGARRTILAAACSVVSPVVYHPRMSRTEAQQLLSACHLGQTERGSYSLLVSCPLRAVEQDQALVPGVEPFTRQTVALLMRSLSRIVGAIEADAVPNVFAEVPQEPVISANLCDAILQMRPPDEDSRLDVKVSWATALAPQALVPSAIRIKHEYFPVIEDISKKLRPAQAPAGALFVGYVVTLGGEPDEDGEMGGEATLAVMHEEQLQFVRVELRGPNWHVAHAALGVHGIVRIKGVFHRGARIHRITDITEFSQVQ